MPTPAATSDTTPEPTSISEGNPDSTSIPEAPNSNRRARRPVPEIPDDAIVMNIRSRRQAYAAALEKVTDFFLFFLAFAVELIRPDIAQKNRLHRDDNKC